MKIKSPQEHVAQRIHMYRTRQGMTMSTLAQKLHINVSTLSKYENGKLSLNINMIFEIAKALNVTIMQLTDYPINTPQTEERPYRNGRSFFRRSNLFYMYQYFEPEKKIYICVLEVIDCPDKETDDVILYFDVPDIKNYMNSEYIYKGVLTSHELISNIYCKNLYNNCDDVTILAKTSFSMNTTTTGLLSALSQTLRNPYSTKVIFSITPLTIDEQLKNSLILNDKHILKEIKRINALVIY